MRTLHYEFRESGPLSHDDIISQWLKKVHGVDEKFAQAIWEMYFQKLVQLARQKLGSLPRRDEDEEDAALSAMDSFLQGAKEGRFPQVGDRDDLWRLLVTITVRKVTARRRRFFAQKRGAGDVRGESVFRDADAGSDGIDQILGEEPTPELADEMIGTCDELLGKLEHPELKTIALYKMESYTNGEIAMLLGCSLRTVHRRLDKIRALWSSEE
jgi:DNA-directed RNA polymerase specialized sigma24 family protein